MTPAILKAKLVSLSPATIRFVALLMADPEYTRLATAKQRGTWITNSADSLAHFSPTLYYYGTIVGSL